MSVVPAEGAGRVLVEHFVVMWVLPDERGVDPGYRQLEIDDELLRGGLVTVASAMPEHERATAIRMRNRYAALHVARLRPGDAVELAEAPFLHLFVARGDVDLEGTGTLAAGDAVRAAATGGQSVAGEGDAEVLVWEMHATAA